MNIRPSNFPLNNADQQSIDAQKGAAGLTERYKDLLGFQAAGQDIGLFYQLEQGAEVADANEIGNYTNSGSDQTKNISRYGNYSSPIEAGGRYT